MQISVIDLSIHCQSDHGKKTNSFNPLRSLAKKQVHSSNKKAAKTFTCFDSSKKKKKYQSLSLERVCCSY
jgi:hypothetical protein